MGSRDKKAWNLLLAQICAGGKPFKDRHTGRRMNTKKNTILFEQSCGEGYNPSESARVTRAGRSYLNGLYMNSSSLGGSPNDFREKILKKKG